MATRLRLSALALPALAVTAALALASVAPQAHGPGPGPAPLPATPGGATAAGPAPAGATLPWDLLDCQYLVAIVPVESSRLDPYLPAGFRANELAGLRPPTPVPVHVGVANIGLEVDVCASGAGAHGPVQDMAYASFWVGVQAPAALRVAGYDDYYVNWDVLIPDADRRALLQAAGLPARDGAVAEQDLANGAVDGLREVRLDLDGFGAITFTLAKAPAPAAPQQGKFVQFTQGEGGSLARWRVDYASTSSFTGAGAVRIPQGTWLADVVASEVVPARFLLGTWDYTNGLIELPG